MASKSKERARQKSKMIFMILLTTAMFVTEIVVGYRTGSLALVNDSFNMISAIISLVIGFICLWLSTKDNKKNTYGWARVEIWAALVNSVFMLALCFSIFTSAIQRLVNPEKVKEADLVLIVGGVGFAVNLVGIGVFLNETFGDLKKKKKKKEEVEPAADMERPELGGGRDCPGHAGHVGRVNETFRMSQSELEVSQVPVKTRKLSVTSADLPKNWIGPDMVAIHERGGPEVFLSDDDVTDLTIPDVISEPVSAEVRRQSFAAGSACAKVSSGKDCCQASEEEEEEIMTVVATVCHIYAGPPVDDAEEIPYKSNSKTKKKMKDKKIKSGNEMNIQGVFLHLLGDAMGSISVIVSGLINKFCQGEWVDRMDPAISLVVVIIIVVTTIPLLKQTSNILLQRVPRNVNIPVLMEELKKEVKDVANVHDLHVWQLVGTRIIASMHIRCSDLAQYIRASKQIKKFFHDNGIHSTTIQPEFIEHVESQHRMDRECYLECGPEMLCHENTCCCAVKKSKKKKISTTSTASGVSFQSAVSTDTAISIDCDFGASFS